MKYIIFGAGKKGHDFIENIVPKEVIYFSDNDPFKWGKTYCGKTVLPPFEIHKVLNKDDDTYVVICMSNEHEFEVAAQLEKERISFFFQEDYCRIQSQPSKANIQTCNYKRMVAFYRKEYELKREQVEFFENNVHPSDVCEAHGYLRRYQLELTRFANDFFAKLEEDNILLHPILAYGGLLGKIRHDGFIPWDDDLDFWLVRDEYEFLRSFFQKRKLYFVYKGRSVWFNENEEARTEQKRWKNNIIKQRFYNYD